MTQKSPLSIETERCKLRLLQETDLDFLCELSSDPDVREFFPDGVQTRAQTEQRMHELLSFYTDYGLPIFIIESKETSRLLGRCGFGKLEGGDVEVGYILAKEYWGKGIATEVLSALLEWARSHLDEAFIVALAMKAHGASQRVMEKCNMEFYKEELGYGVQCRYYRFKLS